MVVGVVGLVAAAGKDPVDRFLRTDVLTERSDGVVAEHGSIEGVQAHVGSGVGGTAGALHVELLNGDRVHGAKVAVGRMDHHRQVDVVEGAPADHELLAATPLFGGCAEDCDTTTERLLAMNRSAWRPLFARVVMRNHKSTSKRLRRRKRANLEHEV